MRTFSFRPALTMRGRAFKGLRGYAGKPFHPPLTDIPIGAYVLAAVGDVVSTLGDESSAWAHELWHAATFVFVGGLAVSVLAALTGLADWLTSTEKGTQARRTANAHALIMVTVTVLAVVDVVWRLAQYDDRTTPGALAVLSAVIAVLVAVGATYGGTLVFDYGFNVETAGDSPVWHPSETDVLPGQKGAGPA
jgi:uncharacterized membrane protein